MSAAYVVGHITIKDPVKWAEYTSRVPETLAPWHAELVFRGTKAFALSGDTPHVNIVVIRFPNIGALDAWYSSPAYQALIPLREQAAEMTLLSYKS